MNEAAPASGADALTPPPASAAAPAVAPAAPAANAGAAVLSESGWRSTLPTELQDHASLKDVPDVAALAKRFIDNHSMARSRIPAPGNTEESWEAFASAIRPENPDVYKIDLPEGFDPAYADHMRPVFHKFGAHPKLVEGIVAANNEYVSADLARRETADQASVQEFRQSYQGDYEADLQQATSALEATGAPKEVLIEMGSKWGSPALMQWAMQFGKMVGPLNLALPNGAALDSQYMNMSPEAAKARLTQLNTNAEWRAEVKKAGSKAAQEREALTTRAAMVKVGA